MKRILDSDTVEFIDGSGDKLVCLVSPRYRDVLKCDDLRRKEAIAGLDTLRASGVDVDKVMVDAQKDPKAIKAARENIDTSKPSPAVRAFQLKAVAVALYLDGEKFGGEAISTVYEEMDAVSAAWVDEQVATVWKTAEPSESDTRGEGVGDTGIQVVSALAKGPNEEPDGS